MAQVEQTPTPTLSMQAQIDQLEAALRDGHGILNGVVGAPETDENVPDEGAEAALKRCMDLALSMNNRLNSLSERVGTL